MDGDVISAVDPHPPSTEILAVESTAVEVPVAHSPPPSAGGGDDNGDGDDHRLADVRAKIVKQPWGNDKATVTEPTKKLYDAYALLIDAQWSNFSLRYRGVFLPHTACVSKMSIPPFTVLDVESEASTDTGVGKFISVLSCSSNNPNGGDSMHVGDVLKVHPLRVLLYLDSDLLNNFPTIHDANIKNGAKILAMVEYYFSDENLPNDNFLLKQVKRDKEGYVSISLIASFRKMKRLTKDSSLIVDALKESTQLVVSSDGKKVKRLHPLPLHPLPSNGDRDPMFCFVVVANLPEDHSVQNIQKIFGAAGSIKSISVKDPHVAKDSANKKANSVHQKANKLVNGKMYALVEYETEEAAEKAVAILNDETDWRYGLRVQLLLKRTVGRKAWKGSNSEKGSHAQLPVPAKEEDNNHSIEQHDDVVDVDDEVGEHTSKERNRRKGRNRTKGRKYSVSIPIGHGTAVIGEPSKPPPGPRMPDGTRGFTMGRGRPRIYDHV